MKKIGFLLTGFLLILTVNLASATTIDFEELSYGQDVAYDLYQSEGIIFDSGIDWEIYNNGNYPKALINNTNWAGDLIGSFINPVSSLSVLMGDSGGDIDTGRLEVYDADGTLLASDFGSGSSWFTVSVAVNNISSFRIFQTNLVVYDEIIFDGSAPSPPIPEPSTILLFGFGILGLARVNRKK